MALKYSSLFDRKPVGFAETEIGLVAVFDLTVSEASCLESGCSTLEDPLEFMRILTRLSCYPADRLRDGVYRPSEPLVDELQVSSLSEASLCSIASCFLAASYAIDVDRLDKKDFPRLLMRRLKDEWSQRSKLFADIANPFRGVAASYISINSQLKKVSGDLLRAPLHSVEKPPLDALDMRHSPRLGSAIREISEAQSRKWQLIENAASNIESMRDEVEYNGSALIQIVAIQAALNDQAIEQARIEDKQRKITRIQNRVVIALSAAALFATVFIGPLSRLGCHIASSGLLKPGTPAGLFRVQEIICGG